MKSRGATDRGFLESGPDFNGIWEAVDAKGLDFDDVVFHVDLSCLVVFKFINVFFWLLHEKMDRIESGRAET